MHVCRIYGKSVKERKKEGGRRACWTQDNNCFLFLPCVSVCNMVEKKKENVGRRKKGHCRVLLERERANSLPLSGQSRLPSFLPSFLRRRRCLPHPFPMSLSLHKDPPSTAYDTRSPLLLLRKGGGEEGRKGLCSLTGGGDCDGATVGERKRRSGEGEGTRPLLSSPFSLSLFLLEKQQ